MNFSTVVNGRYYPAVSTVSVSAGASGTLASISGAGFLTAVAARVTTAATTSFSLTLTYTVDGQASAAIQVLSPQWQTLGSITNSGINAGDTFTMPINLPFNSTLVVTYASTSGGGGAVDVTLSRGVKF